MTLSRRTMAALVGGLPGVALVAWLWRRRRTDASHETNEVSVDSLVMAAQAFIGLPVETAHYESYFRWRTDHLPESRARYSRFLAAVERRFVREGRTLSSSDPATRTRLLVQLGRDEPHDSEVRAVRTEVLALFSRTDAWVHLGYESWPGTARGFANLDGPPLRASR